MTETITLTPSFSPALEREGGCYPSKSMPFGSKMVGWLALAVLLIVAFVVAGFTLPAEHSGLSVYPVLIGAFVAMIYMMIFGRLQFRHLNGLQAKARAKAGTCQFRFSPRSFEIDCANSQTRYDWSAIDEVVALTNGTGLRVGVWVFPISDEDLPSGMTGSEFRAQINAWKSQ